MMDDSIQNRDVFILFPVHIRNVTLHEIDRSCVLGVTEH